MSTEYKPNDKMWTFNCDGEGCHRNFEGQRGNDMRLAWVGAKAEGWVNFQTYWKGISTWKHYCPDCKSVVGD